MYVFDLGKLPGQQSMLIFHTLAHIGIEALVIVSPKTPLASIGYFQDAEQDIDLPYCKELGIPFMRREVGGGATYLDENQIFYQLIWKKDNPKFPKAIHDIFPWFSEASVETYRTFGIQAEYRSINDIITKEGKKIAGEGGGNIGECTVFVGGILLDFDYKTMSRILKVPDEKFRDKVYKTMEENLTTMKRELGSIPPREEVVSVLKEQFQKRLGSLEQVSLNPEVFDKMKQLMDMQKKMQEVKQELENANFDIASADGLIKISADDLGPEAFEEAAGLEDGGVLNGRRDDVAAAAAEGEEE